MSPYLKLAYLFTLFCFMMLHIAIVSMINLGYIFFDPLLLTMPGLIIGQLYIVGELLERWMKISKECNEEIIYSRWRDFLDSNQGMIIIDLDNL